VTISHLGAYHAPMDQATAAPVLDTQPHEPEPLGEWRAIWALEDGQPAWLRDSVAAMDGALQGEMGHT
jgi:hypothetical protein